MGMFYPYITGMPTGPYIPQVWAREVAKHFREDTAMARAFGSPRLTSQDVWTGPDGPESYGEAVAWAALLEVTVTVARGYGAQTGRGILLSRPDVTPHWLPLCSPTELIEDIKSYASFADSCASAYGATIIVDAPASHR